MYNLVLSILKKHKKSTISLLELQNQLPGTTDETIFNEAICQLQQDKVFIPIKASKQLIGNSTIYNSYRINKPLLHKDKAKDIQHTQFQVDSRINLETYMSLSKEMWEQDKPFILKLNNFLTHYPVKKVQATLPERSYQITKDEKWIDEGGGREIIDRLRLWEYLNIIQYPDPLMLTINPKRIATGRKHLIVENKSIFYRLVNQIQSLPFASIIYGSGWKITAGIQNVYLQLGIPDIDIPHHTLYYFGDLDWEGIAIWNSIKHQATLATLFYEMLLKQEGSKGKETQYHNQEALEAFLAYFSKRDRQQINTLLNTGNYIPQEALQDEEIDDVGRRL